MVLHHVSFGEKSIHTLNTACISRPKSPKGSIDPRVGHHVSIAKDSSRPRIRRKLRLRKGVQALTAREWPELG